MPLPSLSSPNLQPSIPLSASSLSSRVWFSRLRLPLLAAGFVLTAYLPATWSQSEGDGSPSLPALPNSTSNGFPANYPPQTPTSIPLGVQGAIAVVGQSNAAASQTHLMSSATLNNGMQQVVLVDPARLTMVVYHVDPNRGDIQLKSVRKLDADFSLEEFNLSEPTPTTIRRNLRLGNDR